MCQRLNSFPVICAERTSYLADPDNPPLASIEPSSQGNRSPLEGSPYRTIAEARETPAYAELDGSLAARASHLFFPCFPFGVKPIVTTTIVRKRAPPMSQATSLVVLGSKRTLADR